ncbi:MAG: tetratricopeptide repeat protein, partial [Bacteroidota bacterium]
LLLIIPYPLTADYSFAHVPFVDFSHPLALLGILLHLTILGFGVYWLWKRKVWGLIFLWYLAPLTIVSNLVFNIGAPMGERFLFLSSFGFCLGIAYLLGDQMAISRKGKEALFGFRQNVFSIGMLTVIGLFAILSFLRNPDWYDNKTLFRHDVQISHQSAKMQYYCANSYIKEYLNKGEQASDLPLLDLAESHLKKGLEIYPDFHYLTYNLGLINNYRNNGQEAKRYLERTLELKSTHMQSIRLLATVNARLLNDLNGALYYFQLAKDTYGDQSEAVLQGLGNVYAMMGRFPESIASFQQLLNTDPQNGRYHLNLAITYERMGDMTNARIYYDRAFQLDPSLKQ